MKVLLLSDINSAHTKKWAIELSVRGLTIGILSLSQEKEKWYINYPNIYVFTLVKLKNNISQSNLFNKLIYLKAYPYLKQVIKSFCPDILHAHYATSYGLLGRLTKFHPFIISLWGSDVYDFPNKFFINKLFLKFVLSKADNILSTSNMMAKEAYKYTKKNIEVVPFGVDINKFKHYEVESLFNGNDIVIGTIKALEENYGIEYVVKAFKILCAQYPNLSLKLLIIGSGSLENKLKELVNNLQLNDKVVFIGFINPDEVPEYLNMLSILVTVSVYTESFGVVVLEASACEKPVVVSNVGGLAEVVVDGETGIIVSPKNPQETADAIEKLILNKDLAFKLGRNGRLRVIEMYNINKMF